MKMGSRKKGWLSLKGGGWREGRGGAKEGIVGEVVAGDAEDGKGKVEELVVVVEGRDGGEDAEGGQGGGDEDGFKEEREVGGGSRGWGAGGRGKRLGSRWQLRLGSRRKKGTRKGRVRVAVSVEAGELEEEGECLGHGGSRGVGGGGGVFGSRWQSRSGRRRGRVGVVVVVKAEKREEEGNGWG